MHTIILLLLYIYIYFFSSTYIRCSSHLHCSFENHGSTETSFSLLRNGKLFLKSLDVEKSGVHGTAENISLL